MSRSEGAKPKQLDGYSYIFRPQSPINLATLSDIKAISASLQWQTHLSASVNPLTYQTILISTRSQQKYVSSLLITGTPTGLGRELTLAALARGDKVIATSRARSLSKLAELKSAGADVLELDVTDSLENLHKIAKEAVEIHGRVDVLINNAGYLAVGALEESTSPQETLDQFNTNVFGALNVSRAFLPYMRKEKKGTVAFLGSIGGWSDVPNAGLYCATKSAIRSITETLHAEISSLGLRAICLELGHFRTGFLAAGHRAPYVPRIEDYYPMSEKADQSLQAYSGNQPGSPGKGVKAIIDVLHGTGVAQGKPFPVVLQLGSDCFKVVTVSCENTLDNLQRWKEVTLGTDI